MADLRDVRQKILAAARSILAAKVDTAYLGTWAIMDLLAHLAGWDVTNQQAVDEIFLGQVPSFYEQHDKDWATYNARLIAKYKCENLDELLTRVVETHQQLLAYLNELPAAEWFKDSGLRFRGYKVQIGRLLAAALSALVRKPKKCKDLRIKPTFS